MKNISQVFVGVDVSKNSIDVYIHPAEKHFKVDNSKSGMVLLLNLLQEYTVSQVVCESSGGYERLMTRILSEAEYKVWVVNPEKIKAFIISEGIKYKTDASDAKMIALFASQKTPKYESERFTPSEKERELRALSKRRADLVRIRVMEKLRLQHPEEYYLKENIESHINYLDKEIEKLEKKLSKLIQENESWNRKASIAMSVPGIGKTTAATLIAEVPELGKIDEKKIAALIGVAPFTQESGAYKGKARTKGGRSFVRSVLYMAALSAIQHNGVMKKFYEKLRRLGKDAKVAIVAVMRRLIVIINALFEKDELWNKNV